MCANKRVVAGVNSLADAHPGIAARWHPERNGALRPEAVAPMSSRRVWWLCERGHEWRTSVSHRTRGLTGCPRCSAHGTSRAEILIWTELRARLAGVGIAVAGRREKVAGHECDVFVPALGIAVEFDGEVWHRERGEQDLRKGQDLAAAGVALVRVRERPLPAVGEYDVSVPRRADPLALVRALYAGLARHPRCAAVRGGLEAWSREGALADEAGFRAALAGVLAEPPGNLEEAGSPLVAQWHPSRNRPLLPRHFTPGSDAKAWWLCERGHEWEASINNRAKGRGCPYCRGRRAHPGRNLATERPAVAAEWDRDLNPDRPEDHTPASLHAAWWRCGRGHLWRARIAHRKEGSGCPVCSGKRAAPDTCLAALNPGLARAWHPERNAALTPEAVTPGSNKKAWWRCERGHEWRAVIASRHAGAGCPYCANKAVSAANSLAARLPALAAEWHPRRNGGALASSVVPGSGKRAWWLCARGHEFEAAVYKRAKGAGCPGCRRARPAMRDPTGGRFACTAVGAAPPADADLPIAA